MPAPSGDDEPFLLELDDDMIDAPQDWDRKMLEAYQALPKVGFLQARLADDGFSPGSDLFYRTNSTSTSSRT